MTLIRPAFGRSRRRRVPCVIAGSMLMLLLVGCGFPSPTATSVLPASPSAVSPVRSPTDEASVRQLTVVATDDRGDRPMSLTIVDPEGLIATARAATPEEITSLAEGVDPSGSRIAMAVAPTDPAGILIVWEGTVCDKSGSVAISGGSGQIVVAPDPRGGCDLIPIYRGLVLTFAIPVDIGAVRPVLLPTKLLGS